jgi:hypothetical protein
MEVSLHNGSTGQVRHDTLDRNKQWALEIRLRQVYWANDAQRASVEKVAMQALSASLYEDVLRELPMLRLAIMSGDASGALMACDRITKATQP